MKGNECLLVDLLRDMIFKLNGWFNYVTIVGETCFEILELATPLIKNEIDTTLRKAVTPHNDLLRLYFALLLAGDD
jgi:hypothetical protein